MFMIMHTCMYSLCMHNHYFQFAGNMLRDHSSGKQLDVGSNPTVGTGSFPARKTGVCYSCGMGETLG